MRPFTHATFPLQPQTIQPGETGRFSFSGLPGSRLIHQILLEGVGRRPYCLSFGLGQGNKVVPVLTVILKKVHGWRVADDGEPLFWDGSFGLVTVENQGKSLCRVTCLLKGWMA